MDEVVEAAEEEEEAVAKVEEEEEQHEQFDFIKTRTIAIHMASTFTTNTLRKRATRQQWDIGTMQRWRIIGEVRKRIAISSSDRDHKLM